MRERSDCGADDDGGSGLPEVEAEELDGDDADEYRCELEVRRKPHEQEVERLAVSFLQGNVLDAARLDRGDPLAIVAFSNGNVLLYFLGSLHRRFPLNKRRRLLTPEV